MFFSTFLFFSPSLPSQFIGKRKLDFFPKLFILLYTRFSIQRDISFTLTLVGFGDFSFSSDPSITMNRYNGNESQITRFKCDSNDSLCDSGYKTIHILIHIVLS